MTAVTEPDITTAKDEVITNAYTGQRDGLLRFISNRIADVETAEDILQDVYYELAERYDPLKPIERVANWLYHVARNKVTDWYRKRKTERLAESGSTGSTSDEEDELLLLADLIPANATPVDQQLFWRSIADELEEALDQLPGKQREVFVMHEIEGISLNRIAELTHTPLKTVISRKRYAVLFLRDYLQDLYNDYLNN